MKEIISPIGMPLRTVDDPLIMGPTTNGYMCMKHPQYLQIIRTARPVDEILAMRSRDQKIALRAAAMEALADHLDSMTVVLNDGSPFSGLVVPEGSETGEEVPVRTAAGLKHFLMLDPETEKLTPGIMSLRGRLLKLRVQKMFHSYTYVEWLSEIALGFKEDGGLHLWEGELNPQVFLDGIAKVLGHPGGDDD